MAIDKFDIVTYIKPNHSLDTFSKCMGKIQNSKYLNKCYIHFVNKLDDSFKNILNSFDNVVWKDGVDNNWATEIKNMIYSECKSKSVYLWEEDSHVYDVDQFDKTFENFTKKGLDHMLTLDKKWIERGEFLLGKQLAIQDDEFLYFNWGTDYAKYCRENSNNPLVKGAYPVTVGSMFSKRLLISLLNKLFESKYWTDITSGNYSHFHRNPKLPHSFEVFSGFWWEGVNEGNGNVQYTTMVSTHQLGEELGGRLGTT